MVGCIACNPTRHITSHFFDNWRLICDFHRIKRACKRANIIDDGKKVNQTKNPAEYLPKYLDQLTQVHVQLINVHSMVHHALIDKAKLWGHLLCTYENTTWLQIRICHNMDFNYNEIIIGHCGMSYLTWQNIIISTFLYILGFSPLVTAWASDPKWNSSKIIQQVAHSIEKSWKSQYLLWLGSTASKNV